MYKQQYNITINSIKLKNFMNFDDKCYHFKNGINIINGSNGQGKSSLTIESLYYLLFSKSLRVSSIKELINKNTGEKSGVVEYSFNINCNNNTDINTLNIKRYLNDKKYKNNAYISTTCDDINIKYGLSTSFKHFETNEIIKNLFKIDNDIIKKIYLKTPLLSNFVDDKNFKIISDILKINDVYIISEIFNKKYKTLKIEYNTIQNEIDKYNNDLKNTQEKLNNIIKKENYVNSNIDNIKNKINELKQFINDNIKKRTELKKKLEKANEEYQKYDNKFNEINLQKNELLNEISELKQKEGVLKSKLSNLKSEYTKYKKSLSLSTCPVCLQNVNPEIIKNKLNEIAKEGKEIKNEYLLLENKVKKLNVKLEKYNKKLSFIKEKKNEYYNRIIKNINNEISSLNDIIEKNNKQLNKLLSDVELSKKSRELIKNFQQILNELKDKISNHTNNIKSIENDIYVFEVLTKIFNKKSPYLNTYFNEKLYHFKKTFLDILKILSNDKFNIVEFNLTKNNFIIINELYTIDMLSSAQKKIVETALLFTLIIYTINKFNLSSFILDEFLDNNLDLTHLTIIFKYLIEFVEYIKTEFNKGIQFIITTNRIDNINDILKNELNQYIDKVNIINL